MAETLFLQWPTTQASYGIEHALSPKGQLKAAKDRAAMALEIAMKDRPGEAVTIAYKFAGFVPHASKVEAE